MIARKWALRTSKKSACRPPGQRQQEPARPRVAWSDRRRRTASKGGVAANIAASFQNALSSAM
eukprot:7083872-Alexandrium_andersonii.AAC.1